MRKKLKAKSRGVYENLDARGEYWLGWTEHRPDGTKGWTWQKAVSRTLGEAKRERASLVSAVEDGRLAPRSDATFAELFESWLLERKGKHRVALSDRSREHSRGLVRLHLASIAKKPVQKITRADLVKVLIGMRDAGYAPATISQVHRLARGVFAQARREKLIAASPADDLANVVPDAARKKEIRRLTLAEIVTLIDSTKTQRFKTAVALAAYAGLRLGELRGAKWSDVDLASDRLRIVRSLQPDGTEGPTKTRKGVRTVPIVPALAAELIALQALSPNVEPSDYVLGTHDGKPLAERNLRRALAQAIERSGLTVAASQRLSWHSLRHSAASVLATELRLPMPTVARVLGHTKADTTWLYAQDDRDDDAVVSDVLGAAVRTAA